MRVVYDVRFFANKGTLLTGIPRYGIEFLTAMENTNGVEPVFVGDETSRLPGDHWELLQIKRCPLWQQWAVPYAAAITKSDLIHGLANTIPIMSPIPTVVTVHDLVFEKMPHLVNRHLRKYLKRLVPLSLSRAKAVIAVSESTARDIIQKGWCEEKKVHVVPLGVGEFWFEQNQPNSPYTERYLMVVGTLDPRKNLLYTLAVFEEICRVDPDVGLVIVGGDGGHAGEVRRFIAERGLSQRVKLMGRVSDVELRSLYLQAEALLYLSLYEGFGLPVLEAMAVGCLPIVSDRGALPTVVGESGVVIQIERPPSSVGQVIVNILQELNSRESKTSRRRRALRFSWREHAKTVREIYNHVI